MKTMKINAHNTYIMFEVLITVLTQLHVYKLFNLLHFILLYTPTMELFLQYFNINIVIFGELLFISENKKSRIS